MKLKHIYLSWNIPFSSNQYTEYGLFEVNSDNNVPAMSEYLLSVSSDYRSHMTTIFTRQT